MKTSNVMEWIIIGVIASALFISFGGIAFNDYLSYLTIKQKTDLIKEAIAKDWSVEQIQGLINSKL